MCMVTIYRGEVAEDNKLWEEVAEYEIDCAEQKLIAVNILGQERSFDLEGRIRWDEKDDVLVI